MRRDGEDGDLVSAGAVYPENPPCGRCLVFGAGFEDFLAVRAFDGSELVGAEAGMAGIGFEQPERLSHGFQSLFQSGGGFQRVEIAGGAVGELRTPWHADPFHSRIAASSALEP